jgi:hypothetical protein
LKSEFFSDSFEPEIVFNLQEKNEESIPDATITQESFKIVVETKLSDWFYSEQLMKHLKSFHDEKYKVIITLAPKLMDTQKKNDVDSKIREYNKSQKYPVFHINTTFEALANSISEIIDYRDFEMQDILDDYLNYCYNDGLISVSDAWKYMRVQLASTTIDFNIENNMYYVDSDLGFRQHEYLGLYKSKSVRAIGKITSIIIAEKKTNEVIFSAELGELTEEKKAKILLAMEDAKRYGYDLSKSHRYFFVEKFYPTDFKKITPYAPRGSRVFDLTEILNTDNLPNVEEICKILSEKTWS